MANPLELLKSGNLAAVFLREAFNAGTGITEALKSLREGGLAIADTTARQIYNYLSGPLNAGREYINNLGLNAIPNITKLAPSLTGTLRNFSYIINIQGVHPFTGETINSHITVSTNTLLTLQEALDTASGIVEGSNEAYGVTDMQGTVVDVLQNSDGLV